LKALGITDYSAGHWKHIFLSWLTGAAGTTLAQWYGNKKIENVIAKKDL
jgi:hypothetical protein